MAQQYGKALGVLSELGPLHLEALLPHVKRGLLGAVENCCHNTFCNAHVFPARKRERLARRLAKYKLAVKAFTDGKQRGRLGGIRALLSQRGSGPILGTVLAATVPIVLSLLEKKLKDSSKKK